MAELDDRQDQLLRQLQEEAAEDNGNGNGCGSCSRTHFDDAATAGDGDDGRSFGSGGTGSEAAEEDGGVDAGTDLDVGRMKLAGGDQQPPTTVAVAVAASALPAMTLTGTATAAAGEAKTKTEADAEAGDDDEDEVEAPPAVIAKAGTATTRKRCFGRRS